MLALTYDVSTWRWLACRAVGVLAPRVFVSTLSGLRLRQVPEPDLPGPRWVRVRTLLGGVCGTDLNLIRQREHPASVLRSFTSFPIALGHENVAVIDRVGSEVADWQPGRRVCVEPSLSCAVRGLTPPCPSCAAGRFSLCDRFLDGDFPPGTMIGLNNFTGGSWGPYFLAHESQLHAVPDAVDDARAVLVDPLACALHAVLRCIPAKGRRVLVQGAGIIGLGVVAGLRALDCGASITALVRHQQQGDRMRALGADRVIVAPRKLSSAQRFDRVADAVGGRRVSGGFGNQTLIGGFDVVYDCVGTGRSLGDAMKCTRPRGTTVAVGTSQIALVDTTPLWFNELTVLGAYGRQREDSAPGPPRHTYDLVLEMMASGKLATDGLAPRVFPLTDYRPALRLLMSSSGRALVKAAFRHEPA